MEDHAGGEQQGIQSTSVGGDGELGPEGVGGDDHDEQKEGRHGQQHCHGIGHQLAKFAPLAEDHRRREERQQPLPEQQRAFEGTPEGGDAVIQRCAPQGITGHIGDAEIIGDQRGHEEQRGHRHQAEEPQHRAVGTGHKLPATETCPQHRSGDAINSHH